MFVATANSFFLKKQTDITVDQTGTAAAAKTKLTDEGLP